MSGVSKYEHGLITYTDDMGAVSAEIPMTQCAHCGGHFPLPGKKLDKSPIGQPGRNIRGKCGRCGGHVCSEACAKCNNGWEAMLEVEEGTRDPTAVSVAVPKSKLWLPS